MIGLRRPFLTGWLGGGLRGRIGPWGERVAARYLRKQGLRLLERNYRARSGEIDLVLLEDGVLVFVEVKTSRVDARFPATERIDAVKQRRLRRAAGAFLKHRCPPIDDWRFDAVVVEYRLGRWGWRRVVSVEWYPGFFQC